MVPGGFIPARKIGAANGEKVVLPFTLPSVEKGEAKAIIGGDKEKGKKVTEVINSDSNESNSHQSSSNDALSESENGSKQRGKVANSQGSIDMNRVAPEEFESDVGNASKKSVSSKGKMDTSTPVMSLAKKVFCPDEAEHSG
ncbi:hypothetical protein SLEP1_g22281 [Rubroshorea leprosula]|uniref:Uncharacterized protein n=1 Tax=Rubroshorea leprosula TaxID=152421 RepID=A0AAV5JJ83_9ROSI|nr:hypothetical protein SLEP1_g22281 [Rubroshorea leprosula]